MIYKTGQAKNSFHPEAVTAADRKKMELLE